MKNKKNGFTLAEVLITLGIIGVVAAITLPTLMQDSSKQQLGVKLAKFQSNLEKITRAAAVEGNLSKDDVCKLLEEELIFDGTYNNKCDGASGSGIVTLRDNTMFAVENKNANVMDGTPSKMGTAVAQIHFIPEISGLRGIGPIHFLFAVTDKGFVVPDSSDECLIEIFKAKYKASKVYGKDKCVK